MKTNDKTNDANEHHMVKNPLARGRPVGYLQVWPKDWTGSTEKQHQLRDQSRTWTSDQAPDFKSSAPTPSAILVLTLKTRIIKERQ